MQQTTVDSLHSVVQKNSGLERLLDRFACIAARLCATPTARLRLAPPHHYGNVAGASSQTDCTPLEDALYLWALGNSSLLVVPDVCTVCADAAHPLPVCPPEQAPFRFFAGVPLQSADQGVLGVLYVLDYAPRLLSDEDRDAFIALGQTAAEQIEMRHPCLRDTPPEPIFSALSPIPAVSTAAQDCIITIDHRGVVEAWNGAAEETFGYTREQAVGKVLADLIIPPEFRERHLRGMERYLKTGDGPVMHRHTEISALRADGSEIPVELVIVPAPTLPGQPLLFTGYVRDISAKLQAKVAFQQVYDDLVRTNQILSREARQRAQAEAAVAQLNQSLLQANQELMRAYDTTIEGWARALDLRDRETEGHSRRVTEVAVRLARRLGMCPHEQIHLRRGALLHDIGKMGIPDHVLLKPGPLDDEEWAIMRRHPEYARDMLMAIDFLRPALDIPYCHHEKWDGTGYPCGLKGEEIPYAARIFSVVDVWDALRSDRPYRPAWSQAQVNNYLSAQAGRFFDPLVVPAFLAMLAAESGSPVP